MRGGQMLYNTAKYNVGPWLEILVENVKNLAHYYGQCQNLLL
jgi:hypothetical protein